MNRVIRDGSTYRRWLCCPLSQSHHLQNAKKLNWSCDLNASDDGLGWSWRGGAGDIKLSWNVGLLSDLKGRWWQKRKLLVRVGQAKINGDLLSRQVGVCFRYGEVYSVESRARALCSRESKLWMAGTSVDTTILTQNMCHLRMSQGDEGCHELDEMMYMSKLERVIGWEPPEDPRKY